MSTTTTFDQSLKALAQWLAYLDSEEGKLKGQIERTRSSSAESGPQESAGSGLLSFLSTSAPPEGETTIEEEPEAEDNTGDEKEKDPKPSWLK
jgi:hypothetical protein